MNLDEAYQAAIQAGSGGIRWNSTLNYIQLMDENKNWINWRRYNPVNQIIRVMTRYSLPSTFNYSVQEDGLYLVMVTAIGSAQITSDGTTLKTYSGNANGPHLIKFIRCTAGNTIGTSASGTNNAFAIAIYYLKGFSNVVNECTVNYVSHAQSATFGYTANTANFMFGIGKSTNRATITGDWSGDNGDVANTLNNFWAFAVYPESDYCSFTGYTNDYGGFVIGYGNID